MHVSIVNDVESVVYEGRVVAMARAACAASRDVTPNACTAGHQAVHQADRSNFWRWYHYYLEGFTNTA